ncbi:MAG: hypothetical protein ACI82A_003711 [Candidatus Azotimanducaceae bacterium]|jgi:uncharacterized protein (DUF58 family)
MTSSENSPDNRFWRSARFQSWLDRRVPPSNSVTLHQKNIFILPTRHGFYFVVLILFMMLAGINYQNSLIFALAFLLVSLFVVSILHTFRNLSGLCLQGGHGTSVFAGEDAEFTVRLSRAGNRTFEALNVGWQADMMQGADLLEAASCRLKIYVPTQQRGRFNPGRLLVQTYYPVGLFRAWSWVDLDLHTVIYPQPIFAGEISSASSSTNEGEIQQRNGVDDFYGLRNYQHGDSIKQIAWKTYARTGDLHIKEFAAYVDRRIWLEWDNLPGLDREARLSRLAWWVIQVSKSTDDYGLRLPGIEIEPARGPDHRARILNTLAMFELPE